MEHSIQQIRQLLLQNNYPASSEIKQLKSSGSERVYYRVLFKKKESVIAAWNADAEENKAWVFLTDHFRRKNLPVPEIFAQSDDFQFFLMEDLGDISLFNLLEKISDQEKLTYFKKAIKALIRFQIDGKEGLDFTRAYPTSSFDGNSILWDLNYFKYYFVKTHQVTFDEMKLDRDFKNFAAKLLNAEGGFFLYRDFQSRNIMVKNGELFFIDFQAGREGPLQYDLVSLLFQARAKLSEQKRNELLNFYLDELEKKLPGRRQQFLLLYHYFIYFRLMQVLGAYGFRGMIQRKTHFLLSIPYAIENLEFLLQKSPLENSFSELKLVFEKISKLDKYKKPTIRNTKLKIEINSFSFLNSGYPGDATGNGGGFVFDCRALPNPGRIEELKSFSGLEKPVIAYLEKSKEIKSFLQNTYQLTDNSIENYLERGFTHLQVNFGCTGGKHRSVYCAVQLQRHLAEKYGNKVEIKLCHKMQNEW